MINDDYRPIKTNHYPSVKNKSPIKKNNFIDCKTPPTAPIYGSIKCSKVRLGSVILIKINIWLF